MAGGLSLCRSTIPVVTVLAVLLLIGVAFYFIPTVVAIARRSSNTVAVVLINVFLGWSLIGWIVALVLAATGGPRYRNPFRAYPPHGLYGPSWYPPAPPYQGGYEQPGSWNPPAPPGGGHPRLY